jgi:hypothetical protein
MKAVTALLGWFTLGIFLAMVSLPVARAEDFTSSSFIVRDPSVNGIDNTANSSSSFQQFGSTNDSAVGSSASTSFTANSGVQNFDNTPPVIGVVRDGTTTDDLDQQTAMDAISANWSGFTDAESGIKQFDYSLQRVIDNKCWNNTSHAWEDCTVWNSVGTATTYTVNHANLALRTGTQYVSCIRATNNVDLTSSACSNGVFINPSITFSYDSSSVDLPNLTIGNNWNAVGTSTLTVQTNAYSGYSVWGSKLDLIRSISNSALTISDLSDGGCSGSAVSWPGATNFGFSSSSDVDSNKFHSGGTKYCAFPTTGTPTQGIEIADYTSPITGGNTSDTNTVTYRAQVDAVQPSGKYRVTVIYAVMPRY